MGWKIPWIALPCWPFNNRKLFLFEGSNEEEDRWMEGEVSFNNREEDFGEAVLQSMPTYDCVTS